MIRLRPAIVACILLLVSCEKKQEVITPVDPPATAVISEMEYGLPKGTLKVDGYFYTAFLSGEKTSDNLYAFAAFGSSKKNLTRNYNHLAETNRVDTTGFGEDIADADAGIVSLNGYTMNFLTLLPMTYIFPNNYGASDFKMDTRWVMKGKGSFLPTDLNVTRKFPQLKLDSSRYILTEGKDFVIALDSATNYDSLVVILHTSNTNLVIKKIISPGSKTLTFTAVELSQAYNDTGYILFNGFNYSTRIISGKLYLYEQAYKTLKYFNYPP